jgi:hypothetical protein
MGDPAAGTRDLLGQDEAGAEGARDFRKSVAVVIGINDYSAGVPALRTPREDAAAVARLLGAGDPVR